MYRKPHASDNLLNFKHAVSPEGQKISTLVGELYRCNNTTTTPEALNLALKNTKNFFLKNQYPEKLKNPEIINHTINLPFTSFRCSIIARKMKQNLT